MLNKYKLNLQMFADDDVEEIEDGDLPEVSEDDMIPDEDEKPEKVDVDEEDDSIEDDDGEDLDKKTKALIKYKQDSKKYKQQLEELQNRLREEEIKSDETKRIDELKRTGVSEDVAKRTAEAETRAKMMEVKLAKYEYAELQEKYPSIDGYKKEIEELRIKHPDMSREELYLAKFYKNASFEERRKIEAEMSYTQRKAKDKAYVDGVPISKDSAKLTKSEESSYREVKKSFPKMTKAQFLKSLNEEEEIDF